MDSTALALLHQGLQDLGLDTAPNLEKALAAYLKEIRFWNPKYGLVGTQDPGELITKHILDSLAPLKLLGRGDQGLRAADVGSGAGLPGIPLALARPGWSVTLIEKQGKRCRFLENQRVLLGGCFEVVNADAQAVTQRFDLVVFRAVTALDSDFGAILWNLVAPGGTLAAWKGRRDTLDPELAALGGSWGTPEIHPVSVPGLPEERHLVLFTKEHS